MPLNYCAVVGCAAQKKRDGVLLFSFPVSMRDRSIWTRFCCRPDAWQPSVYASYICSRHFVDGKPSSESPHPLLEPAVLPADISTEPSSSSTNPKNVVIQQFCYDLHDDVPAGIERLSVGGERTTTEETTAAACSTSGDPVESLLTGKILITEAAGGRRKTVKKKMRVSTYFSRSDNDHCYNAKVTAASSSFSYSSTGGSGTTAGSPTSRSSLLWTFIEKSRRRSLKHLPSPKLRIIATKYIRK